MRIKLSKRGLIVLAGLVAAFALSSCKATRMAKRTRLKNESMDLGSQCRKILEENRSEDGRHSEESIYRGLFKTLSLQRAPLDQAGAAFANKISEDFLHFSGLAYKSKYGNKNFRQEKFADGFRTLVRAYVSMLGPAYYGTLAGQSYNLESMLDNNTLGQWTNVLRQQHIGAYEIRAGKFLQGLKSNRGISMTDLLLLYMLEQYPELFHLSEIVASSGIQGLDTNTPTALIENKTTPALACNNHAAQVVAEPIPWKQLGMDHYEGFGFIPWFHEPIARFKFEFPTVSSYIPLFGAAMDAADSLVTLYEGRDKNGREVGKLEGSVHFTFYFTMAVFDAFAAKVKLQASQEMVSRIKSRVRGLEPSPSGLQELTAVLKDEAMTAEAAARPLVGRNLAPCKLTSWLDTFSLVGTAYAASLPCFKGLRSADALHQNISNGQRLEVIKDVKVADVMSAPGHQYLREPNKVISLADHIRQTGGAGFDKEPILINIFTSVTDDGSVGVRSIEVADGNHRFAAGLLSGKWNTIGDIPQEYLKVKVNGWEAHASAPHARWIPLDVAEKSSIPRNSWFRVPDHWENVKGPTAQIPGDIASVDDVFPLEYRGVRMEEVLRTSLERVNSSHLMPGN